MEELSVVDRLQLLIQFKIADPLERHVRAPLRRLRNAGRDYRPIFVAGASGSGTSFLAVTLGQKFDCAGVVYEIDAQISEQSFLHVPSPDASANVAAYLEGLRAQEAWSVDAGRNEFLAMFRAASTGESEVIIAKGPDINLTRAKFLARCFPTSHFVLVFRDPVANIEGLRRKWRVFGDDTLAESIRFWRETHERFEQDAREFPERVTFVEYEKLVELPDPTFERIAARCDLSPATSGRRLPTRPNMAGKGIRNVRNSEVGVVRDATQEAIARMDPKDVAEIRAALSPLHQRLRSASLDD